MNEELRGVYIHMRDLGLGALAHANWHAHSLSPDNVFWAELSVIQAAHAAEILIKARIAQEHPLLIFETLPKPSGSDLCIDHLVENGRTYQYSDLPTRLWATTGIQLPNLDKFNSFGRLRNTLQHFTYPPGIDLSQRTMEFIFEVIDPFINKSWGLFAVDFNEDYEPYVYQLATLVRSGVKFLVSPEAARDLKNTELDWPPDIPSYKRVMERRFAKALKGLRP